nr:TPA: orf y [Tanacetum cinerariifolium]
MTPRRPSILNRSSMQKQTELPTQEDQIRGYRQMAQNRHQVARTTIRVFERNNYNRTLETAVDPERQLEISRERRANLVPAEADDEATQEEFSDDEVTREEFSDDEVTSGKVTILNEAEEESDWDDDERTKRGEDHTILHLSKEEENNDDLPYPKFKKFKQVAAQIIKKHEEHEFPSTSQEESTQTYQPPHDSIMGPSVYPPAQQNPQSFYRPDYQFGYPQGKKSGVMLVLPADPGLWSEVISRWESITINRLNNQTWSDNKAKLAFVENLLGESEKLMWQQWRTMFPEAYTAPEAIADEPQNITSQVRQLILLEDPYRGSTDEQDRAYRDLDRITCENRLNPTKLQSEWINLMRGDQLLKTLNYQQQKKQLKPCETYKQSYNAKLKSALDNQPRTTTGQIKEKMFEFKIWEPEESSSNWKPWHRDWDATTSNFQEDDASNDGNKYRYNRKGFLEDDDARSDDLIFIVDPGWEDYYLQVSKLNRPVPLCPDARRARRKAYLLEDKQIPSVGVFDEHLDGIWRKYMRLGLTWGRNIRDYNSTPKLMKNRCTQQHRGVFVWAAEEGSQRRGRLFGAAEESSSVGRCLFGCRDSSVGRCLFGLARQQQRREVFVWLPRQQRREVFVWLPRQQRRKVFVWAAETAAT